MQAQYLPDGNVCVIGASRSEIFSRIWAGIGWPDVAAGHLCVVGERLDKRYHALWESSGGLWELGDAAVKAKDSLLLEAVWVDPRDELATSYLRTLDGLCFHQTSEADDACCAAHTALSALREAVAAEPTAVVMPVPDRISSNYRSAMEKTRWVIARGGLLIHEANCRTLTYTLRQPLDDLLHMPAMKALVWVINALEESRGNDPDQPECGQSWYGNLDRHPTSL